jgi:hypothetical protein
MTRWAIEVRYTSWSILGRPLVWQEYYRWRWLARLNAKLIYGTAPWGIALYQSRMLGRVTLKEPK